MHTVQTHVVKGATVLRNIMDLLRVSLASGSVHLETCFSWVKIISVAVLWMTNVYKRLSNKNLIINVALELSNLYIQWCIFIIAIVLGTGKTG